MLNYLKMFLSVSANVTRNTLMNAQKKKTPTESEILLYNMFCSLVTCLALLLTGRGFSKLSMDTAILAVFYAVALVTSYQTLMMALKEGPMSYTILISTCGMILPTLFGIAAYKEAVTSLQILGFVLMPIGFYFGTNPRKNEKITVKWLKYVFTCFFSNGMQGILQKVVIRSEHASENGMFLTCAFFLAALLLAVLYFLKREKNSKRETKIRKYQTAVIVGLMDAFQHKTNLVLSGVLPSIICYPVINGGGILGATVVSVVFLKEKMDQKQKIGFVICVVSIIFMCM